MDKINDTVAREHSVISTGRMPERAAPFAIDPNTHTGYAHEPVVLAPSHSPVHEYDRVNEPEVVTPGLVNDHNPKVVVSDTATYHETVLPAQEQIHSFIDKDTVEVDKDKDKTNLDKAIHHPFTREHTDADAAKDWEEFDENYKKDK